MQTIGERLEEGRKKKGISIREAAEATKIRGDYLQKFESNQFDIGLTEIYTRGFLRTYANYLKLPADRIINDYAALGRGEIRPRQPNREVYGRMDITIASADQASERAAPPPDSPAPEGPAPAHAQPRFPRHGGTSLPTGPDPAVIFKWVKIGGGAVIVIVALLILKSLLGGGSSPSGTASTPPAATNRAPATSVREPTITLVALGPVRVTVFKKVPAQRTEETYGDVIWEGWLARGETKVVPRPTALYIQATACENLEIEVNGRRFPTGLSGAQTVQLDPPPRS